MPYLTFSRKLRASMARDDKVAEDLIKAKERHWDLLRTYENKVIHGSPTLDESYYHFADDPRSQDDRRDRNKTQVVTKILEPYEKDFPFWTLLRVNQLWVWVISDKLLITATTHPVDSVEGSLLSDIFGYLGKKTEAGESRAQPSTAVDLSKMLIDHCIDFYEREQVQTNQVNQSTRQIYFHAINEIAIQEANLYAKFSLEKRRDDRSNVMSVENVTKAISEAAGLSCDIKDILDELNILKTIATHQHTVQTQLSNVLTNSDISKAATLPDLEYSAARIIDDIEAMDRAADRIHSAVDTILALEQNESANKLATIANDQNIESVKQGQTLMTFTIITTIFLPLSFLSSMFALDYDASQKTPGKVYGIIVGVAVGVFLLIVVFGLKFHQSTKLGRDILTWLGAAQLVQGTYGVSGSTASKSDSYLQKDQFESVDENSQMGRIYNGSLLTRVRRGARKPAAVLPR